MTTRYFYVRDSVGKMHGVSVGAIESIEGVRGFHFTWGRAEPLYWAGLPGQGFGRWDYAYSNGGVLYVGLIDRVLKEDDHK